MNSEQISSIITSISKLGYLDEQNCRKIENTLEDKLNQIPSEDFVNILFCICRNRCASEGFMNKLENVSESILDDYINNNKRLNTFTVTMIAKCNK
jgi:lantibiotic modifying enzyme